MRKNLTHILVTGLIASTGCIINTNTTDSGSETEGTATDATTDGTSTADDTSTTDGTSTSGTGTDSDTGTSTAAPTATESPTSTSDDTSTTDDTTAGTTGGSEFGNCGWDPNNTYYVCGFEGADPGNLNPIECPDTLPNAGDPCDEDSPISGVGCCLPDGKNYYCTDQNVIAIDECGA